MMKNSTMNGSSSDFVIDSSEVCYGYGNGLIHK